MAKRAKAKRDASPLDAIVSTATAAKAIGKTSERVRQLSEAGWVRKAGRDRFRLGDVIGGYLAFLEDEARRNSRSIAAARLAAAKAEAIERRNAREDRRTVAVDEALDFVSETLGRFKADFYAIPPAVTRDLLLRTTIEERIDDVFQRAADHFRKEAAALRAGANIQET